MYEWLKAFHVIAINRLDGGECSIYRGSSSTTARPRLAPSSRKPSRLWSDGC